ncbi:MAG TPA: VOC family protein [Candidatus Paceibacterota bacterium]
MDKVVHFELPADDLLRAKKFYTDVFGWEMQDFPEMKYIVARSVAVDEKQMPKEQGAINGGLVERGDTIPVPTIFMKVESIEETIKKIEGAGGSVVLPKTAIAGMGSYARIRDTEGNIVGLWE